MWLRSRCRALAAVSSSLLILLNLAGLALGVLFICWERNGARLQRAALADRSA